MKPRPLLASLGLSAVVACSLVPAVGATAATPTSQAASSSSAAATLPAPRLTTVNGQSSTGGRIFDFSSDDNVVFINAHYNQAFTARLYDVSTGKTLCEAENDGTSSLATCHVAADKLAYGTTDVALQAVTKDGETSSASETYHARRTFSGSSIAAGSYDDATQTAELSGKGLADEPFTVSIPTATAGERKVVYRGTVGHDGLWTASVTGLERQTKVYFSMPDYFHGFLAFTFIPAADRIPTPDFETTTTGGIVTLEVKTELGTSIEVRNAEGKFVAAGAVNPEPYFSGVRFADPGAERQYTFTLTGRGAVSDPIPFTVNSGLGSAKPDAPTVKRAEVAGDRLTAVVAAQPGAVVKVADASGKLVAAKVAGSEGTAQIAFTLPAGRSSVDYEVTQTSAGVTSAPASLDSGR